MHLYKHFFKMLAREKMSIILYAIIFAVMVGLISFIANQATDNGNSQNMAVSSDISYKDMDDSYLSRGLIEYLSINNNLNNYSDVSELRVIDLVYFRVTAYHMDIPSGFGEAITNGEESDDSQIKYSASMNNGPVVVTVDDQINHYISVYASYIKMGYSEEEAASTAIENCKNEVPSSIYTKDKELIGQDPNEVIVQYTSQYYCYLLFGLVCLAVGSVIIKNNKNSVANRIESGPVSKLKRSLVNTIGLITSGIAVWFIFNVFIFIVGFGTVLYDKYWWVLLLNSFVTTLTICSIASVFSSFPLSQNSLSMITNISGLAMSFLTGVFVPTAVLGADVLRIGRFLPFYWSVKVNNMLIPGSGEVFSKNTLLVCLGVQILFAIAFGVVSILIKNVRAGKRA